MFYSQKDPKWANTKLGTCSDTMGQSACLLTSCTNLFPRLIDFSMNPSKLNDYCKKNKLFVNGCMLSLVDLSLILGLTYKKTTANPKVTCICETDHYKSSGFPQHFFMWKPDGTIIDPLDLKPDWKKNPYGIVSYRVFKSIKQATPPENPPVVPDIPKPTENVSQTLAVPQNEPQPEISTQIMKTTEPIAQNNQEIMQSTLNPQPGPNNSTLTLENGISGSVILTSEPKSWFEKLCDIIFNFFQVK